MFKALQAKFTQHKDLKELLLSTKNRELVEHSPFDSYWGDGGDGLGKNKLGILLMKLRKDLTPTPRVCTPPTPVADPPTPPTSVHSHLQRDAPADTEPSSSPKQHKQRDWATPPRVSPERSSNQQSDNLAGQPVFHHSQQNSAVLDQNRAQLGPTSPTQQGVSMSNPQQPFQSGDQQSAVISASQPHPQSTPNTGMGQPSPQLSTVNQSFQLSGMSQVPQPSPQSATMQTTPQPSTASQNLQSGMYLNIATVQADQLQSAMSQQSNTFSQTSAQPTLPYTPLNDISETASATQQVATATNGDDLMNEFNVSNLTRNHLPGYQTTAAGGSHASMPVHVQSAPNPNSSSQAKDPLPMDTSK